MKRFFTLVSLALVAASALAADFRVSWTDTNSPAYQVGGYNLYMAVGTNAFQLAASTDTNTTSVVVTNLTPNTYRFYLTATNVWGESAPSTTVQTPPGLPSAQGLQIFLNLK